MEGKPAILTRASSSDAASHRPLAFQEGVRAQGRWCSGWKMPACLGGLREEEAGGWELQGPTYRTNRLRGSCGTTAPPGGPTGGQQSGEA